MTLDIDVGAIETAMRDALIANSTVTQYSNFVKVGDYDSLPVNGIDVYVRGNIPIESPNGRILYGSTYNIPIEIMLLCRYKTREKLTETLNKLCSEITRVIYKSGKLSSTNGYILPIEITDDAIGQDENPEAFMVSITVTYEMLLIVA